MTNEKIARINELYKKFKAGGLRVEAKKEQALLRQEYVASVKANLRNQLNNIDMMNADGSVENLGEKYRSKTRTSYTDEGKERPDFSAGEAAEERKNL